MLKKRMSIAICVLMFVSFQGIGINNSIYAIGDRTNSTYIYSQNTNTSIKNVDKTNNSLDMVYPGYFDLNEDGTLKLTSQFDQNFVDDMHSKGIKVVPFLSNHWDRNLGRAALDNKEVLSDQICSAIIKYDLDGVNVDLENLTQDDKDEYTQFVKLLNSKLGQDKEVSVAVAANPRGYNTGWQASYDYEALANNCDYLVLMAYDESYEGSNPGPVASIQFVEDSIKNILKYTTPDKVVLAVPFYGRYWVDGEPYSQGGRGVGMKSIENTMNTYEGHSTYDKETESVKGSVVVDGKQRTYWYENEESLKQKLSLVDKYELRGASSWALGQEDPEIWNNYNEWLNGYVFKDISNHWAKDDILKANDRNLMTGVTAEYFYPERGLTRAEAATILVRMMDIPVKDVDSTFDDTSGHWAKNYIEAAKENNIITGVDENNFAPDENITREEVAVMLDRISNDKQKNHYNVYYNDVTEDMWSYEAIMNMSEDKIFNGVENNFNPQNNITRAEMACVVNRFYDKLQN